MKRAGAAFAPLAVVLLLTAFGAPRNLAAQEPGAIRGTVTDAQTGEAISGAQVMIRGTGLGTITNNEGRYLLTRVPSGRAEIRVERMGYSPQARTITVTAGETATADFQLGVMAIELEGLVATGYAQQARSEVSSAISSVQNKVIQNQPTASLDAALQGRAPGVQITQNAGNPGNGITVRIRGSASISASNQPLYVVDGMPIFSGDFGQLGLGGQDMNAITGLNPEDIESIDILKDAAAAAIYGAQGSNGVIMITTKRGAQTAGRPTVSFKVSSGFQQAQKKLRMLSTAEWIQYFGDGMRYDGYTEQEVADEMASLGVDPSINTDWQSAVMRTAPITTTQLSVSGGTDAFKYYLSGTYFDQMGIIIGSGYKRANGRANLDIQASEKLNVTTSLGLVRESNDRIESDNSIDSPVTNAIANEPWAPIYNADGTYSAVAAYANPVAVGKEDFTNATTTRGFGNITANYAVTDWLTATARAGFDILGLREFRYNSPLTPLTYGAGVGGVSRIANSSGNLYVTEGYLNARRYFGAHEVALTAGASQQKDRREQSFIRAESFTSPDLHWPGNGADVAGYDGNGWSHNVISYFGRANYTYDNKYIVNVSVRTDGSSRFGENNKFGVFRAASLAWAMSQEPFMRNLDFISDLKLRASWGETGNEGIGNFRYLGLYGTANYGPVPGTAPTNLGNNDLKWETTTEKNVGVDMTFFGDRLGVVLDLYQKDTKDLLLNRPVTATSGFTSVLANVGRIRNSGWELSLNTVNLRVPDHNFEWTTEFNIAHNANKVTALYKDEPFSTGFVSWVAVGQPLGVFYLPKYIGVDHETGVAKYIDLDANGDVQYDANGDIVWTTFPGSDDRMVVGSPHPDYYGGLRNTLSYGPLDLMVFFDFSRGAQIYNAMREYSDDGGYFTDNKFKVHVENYWTPDNMDGTAPSPSWYGSTGAWEPSSRYVEDASFVRLNAVSFGFRLPGAVNRLFRMTNGRLFVTGNNIYTWTKYSGYSPEDNYAGSSGGASTLGTEFYSYPMARSFTIGFQGNW
jgi:TonB-linked SusC/RagA family outer membrane protein